MEIAEIYVKGVTASAYNVKKIPKGIIGATIKVTFANDWQGLEQMAVFQGNIYHSHLGQSQLALLMLPSKNLLSK